MSHNNRSAILLLFVIVASSQVTSSLHAAPTNLVVNGSLEAAGTGGNPDRWLRGGFGTNTRVFTYPVADANGGRAAKVDITSYTSGDAKWYFANVPVTSGNPYTLSYKYTASVPTGISYQFTNADGSLNIKDSVNVPVAGAWTLMTDSVVPPAGAVALTAFIRLSSVGSLTIDDVSLTSSSEPPPPPPPPPTGNLIQNPSFETAGTGGDPSKWFRGGWGTNTRVFTYPVADANGGKAAKVDITSYSSGDAKWYFANVPVTVGEAYTFSFKYKSTVKTSVAFQYTKADGTVFYADTGNAPATGAWTLLTQTVVPPVGAVSATAFVTLASVGSLTVDDYSLTHGIVGQFDKGQVTFTFDDGYISHSTDAMPILDSAGIKGTFFIISQKAPGGGTPTELITNPSLETIGTNGNPQSWLRGGWGTNTRIFTYPVAGIDGARAAKVDITSFTTGDAKWYFADVTVTPGAKYLISDSYNSTTSSETVIQYTLSGGGLQYLTMADLPSTGGTWQQFSREITVPANVTKATMFHLLDTVGTLTVDKYSLTRVDDNGQLFMNQSQILALQSAGHEIGAHTRTHPSLPALTASQQQSEIAGSRSDLLGIGATPVANFAYPFGDYDTAAKTVAQNAGFTSARSVDRGFNTKFTDKFALKIQQVDRKATVAQVQAWVNQAIADKTWLILLFHQINDDPAATYGTTRDIFQQTVNYVVASGAGIITTAQGVALQNQ